MTYGIIGVGATGAALVTGLCEGLQNAPSIVLSPAWCAENFDPGSTERRRQRGGRHLDRKPAAARRTGEQFLGVLEQARVFDTVSTGLDRVLARLTRR